MINESVEAHEEVKFQVQIKMQTQKEGSWLKWREGDPALDIGSSVFVTFRTPWYQPLVYGC